MNPEVEILPRVRTRLPADQRRAQILSHAARLFMERGYAGVGIDDIGAAVGISGPAVYRHVAGKEQLVTEIAVDWLDLLLASCTMAYEASHDTSAEVQLRALLGAAVEVSAAHVSEVTVVLRYTDALRSVAIPGTATAPVGSADATPVTAANDSSIPARCAAISRLWEPVIARTHPHFARGLVLPYLGAAAGLIIGAANAEREVPHAIRHALLTDAMIRVLDVHVEPAGQYAAGGVEPFVPGLGASAWVRASRREQILDTSVRMFCKRGYGGVSMADIADEVGVTPSASYRHFASKEELLATAVERAGERMVLGLGAALSHATSAQAALDSLIDVLVHDAVANSDSFAVYATERFHLSDREQAASRKRDRLLVEEWSHCLAALRPDLTTPSRELLVHAAYRLVVEVVRTLASGGPTFPTHCLISLCHAILDARADRKTASVSRVATPA